jgi:hypothetical protein
MSMEVESNSREYSLISLFKEKEKDFLRDSSLTSHKWVGDEQNSLEIPMMIARK